MFRLDIQNHENITPWEISLAERIVYMTKNDGKKICIIVYEKADTSTFRYRGYNIFQSMQNSSKWKSVYFFADELDSICFYLKRISIVVASRTRWTHKIQRFIEQVKMCGIPFLFDTDDCVFDLDCLPVLMNTLNVAEREEDYDYWFSYVSRMGHVAEQADGYISTNSFLGAKLEQKYKKKGYVIPNFLNEQQIAFSKKCCELKNKEEGNGKFVIGYFSGTPSHINDFLVVYRDILELMEKYSDIYLYVVGFMEFPREMVPLVKTGRIKLLKLVDFITLQKLIAEVDVNIVPLVINDFTNCKSELKYFEASIVDTITCASPIYTYKNAIEDGVNGFLCSQTQWYDTLELIYLQRADVKNIVANAHKQALSEYYGKHIRSSIESVYDRTLDHL